MQVAALAGGRAARIDVDDAHAALGPRRLDALIEDRVAPGGVGARQHHEVGKLQIVVALGHHIGAECAAMAGHGRGHAQARVGVDVRRADEAFRQLVGDVVVLGQQLAREIEGDRLGAVRGPDRLQPLGDLVEGMRPVGPRPIDDGVQQARLQPQRLAQRRALGAQPPGVGRVLGIALDGGAALAVGRGEHAAADPAVGAGGAHGRCRLAPRCPLLPASRESVLERRGRGTRHQ